MKKNVAYTTGGGRRGKPRQPSIDKRLCISVDEAAIMLGLSRNFAYDLVKQKQLPVVRFGKRILIPRVALEEMLKKGDS
ncbi:MAG: helix-turn-helix domain-containing protein [Dehalococcoidales bacterium]|nr:helix-turn-helix domain-containing protein [Dehalococcoidales bacterium]